MNSQILPSVSLEGVAFGEIYILETIAEVIDKWPRTL